MRRGRIMYRALHAQRDRIIRHAVLFARLYGIDVMKMKAAIGTHRAEDAGKSV